MLAIGIAAMTLMGLFVSPEEAAALIGADPARAVVLDARDVNFWGFRAGHLPGATPIDWKRYRDGWGRTGRLGEPAAMAQRLAGLGVDHARPVLVYGDGTAGFGEEGRIAWLLLYLGHADVHILDGGFAAWRAAGRPLETGGARTPRPGSFTARPQARWRADKDRARALSSARAQGVLLDVRTDGEWQGQTPYFEARGGHIPRAVHLPWTRLFDERGRVLPRDRLRAVLTRAGVLSVGPAEPEDVVLYCTGGVRSAMAWAALRAAGLGAVRNYDGSFWEWAADRSLPVTR